MEHVLEPSKTSRSRCRVCRETIEEGELRFGLDREGFYADSAEAYAWYHPRCAARSVPKELQKTLASIKKKADVEDYDALVEACKRNAQKLDAKFPYGERAPSGRARCMKCELVIAKGELRVAVERAIVTPTMTTVGAGYLHPACAIAFTQNGDLSTAVANNTSAISADDLRELVSALEAAATTTEVTPKKVEEPAIVPRDPAPLVMADALLDAGDPRGELIMLEDRLRTLDLPLAERLQLERRRDALTPEALERWQAVLPARPNAITSMSRGLPVVTIGSGLKVDVEKVLADPAVRALALRRAPEKQIGDIITSPAMAKIESLEIEQVTRGRDLAEALAGSPNLSSLRRLCLTGVFLDARSVFQLLSSTKLSALEDLTFGRGFAVNTALLARAAGLPALRRLEIESVLSAEAAVALMRSPLARRLESIELWAFGAVVGIAETTLPNLRHLGLGHAYLDAKQAAVLFASKGFPALRSLSLRECWLKDRLCEPLADPQVFPGLERLDVRKNELSRGTLERLAARLGEGLLADPPKERAKKAPAKKTASKKTAKKTSKKGAR